MSIKSFINSLWRAIQSVFNILPPALKTAIHIGVTVTENIKNFVDSPLADVLTTVIPGDIDDKVMQILSTELPQLLSALKLADQCGESADSSQILKCAIQNLQNLDNNTKSAFLHNISVLITQLVADDKLSWSDGVCVVEWYYQKQFKKTA